MRPLCEGVEGGDFDFLAVIPEPGRGVCGKSLRRSKLIVAPRDILPVLRPTPLPNWLSPGRADLSSQLSASRPMNSKRKCFMIASSISCMAWRLRLGVPLPTVSGNMSSSTAELIGKLHPGSLAR